MLQAASECMKCIQCLNLELVFTWITWVKNFMLPEYICYPYRVCSHTGRSAIFHLWLALLSHNRRRKSFEWAVFLVNYEKQHTHCSLTSWAPLWEFFHWGHCVMTLFIYKNILLILQESVVIF